MRRLGQSADGTRGPRPQVLIALWGAGFVLFNFPMLIVWDAGATVFGLPLLPVALFTIWAGLIAALALASEGPGANGPAAPRRHPAEGGPDEGGPDDGPRA